MTVMHTKNDCVIEILIQVITIYLSFYLQQITVVSQSPNFYR